MGYLLDETSKGQCTHGGSAQPIAGNPRVKLGGKPVLTMASQLAITGCTLNPPPPPACQMAAFTSSATRVKVGGVPVVLDDSAIVNAPNGSSTTITVVQRRVKGM